MSSCRSTNIEGINLKVWIMAVTDKGAAPAMMSRAGLLGQCDLDISM